MIIAYTEQWFPYLPEIAGNGETGYESFFWAHNVIAEGLALVLLIGIAYGLFRINPGLAEFATGPDWTNITMQSTGWQERHPLPHRGIQPHPVWHR